MWIVIVVDDCYPSVFHFDGKDEAIKSFKKNRDIMGFVTHLAKVEDSKFNDDVWDNYDLDNISTLDVEWNTDR